MSKAKEPTQADLMAALNFSEDDLKANRAGFFTQIQRERIRRAHRTPLFLTGIGVVLLTVLIRAFTTPPLLYSDKYIWGLIALPTGCLICFAVVMNYRMQWDRIKSDLGRGQVAGIRGVLYRRAREDYHPDKQPRTLRSGYEIMIGDEHFQVSHRVYQAFIPQKKYDVYYAPKTRTLLSAELTEE